MPAASLVLGRVAPQQAGAASGILQTVQQLGGAIGLAVIASVYASRAVPGQFVPGFGPALLSCSAFALLSVLAAVLVVPHGREARSEPVVEAAQERAELTGTAARRAS